MVFFFYVGEGLTLIGFWTSYCLMLVAVFGVVSDRRWLIPLRAALLLWNPTSCWVGRYLRFFESLLLHLTNWFVLHILAREWPRLLSVAVSCSNLGLLLVLELLVLVVDVLLNTSEKLARSLLVVIAFVANVANIGSLWCSAGPSTC